MFWAGAMAKAKQLARRASIAIGAHASDTSDITDVSDAHETSSTQQESSEIESRWGLREWPSVRSLMTSSSFSEMSDRVTVDQQRREEQNAMALNRDGSPVLEKFIRTGKWIQNNGGELNHL